MLDHFNYVTPIHLTLKVIARGIFKLTNSESNGLFELASTQQWKLKRKRLLGAQTRVFDFELSELFYRMHSKNYRK